MRERPIIFSAPMVRALLAGTKSQTRRIVRPQPPEGTDALRDIPGENHWWAAYATHDANGVTYRPLGSDQQHSWRCPFGRPGDLLWVRETWYCDDYRVQRGPYLKPEDFDVDDARCNGVLVYKADGDRPYEAEQPVWRPSIFMPRWASRITLEITGVRVERLQDISEADAIAEGCRPVRPEIVMDGTVARLGRSAVDEYRQLWQSIHGPESWAANPWVWCITFRRVS